MNYRISKNTKALFFINILLFFSQKLFSQAEIIQQKFVFTEQKMGSAFSLTFFDKDSIHAKYLANNAFKIVDSLNLAFSDYLENSEISFISKKAGDGEWVKISKDLLEILLESKKANSQSEGAFNICLGQLTKLWRISKKTKVLPNQRLLNKLLSQSGIKYLLVDKINCRAKLSKKGASIDLGGIGKGFAAQKVFDYFLKKNINSIIVNAAGNMAIGQPPMDQKYWKVGIELPERPIYANIKLVNLKNCAISTSGDVFQHVEINGKKYSHIINPKTGLGLNYQRQVTIICENAMTADWLSTACYILPKRKALSLAKNMGAELLVFEKQNNKIITYKSAQFSKYFLEN